jgi:Transglycosylase
LSVRRPRRRARFRLLVTAAAALAIGAGALAARPAIERLVRARVEAEAARRGLASRIEEVRVGLWPPLRLTGVVLEITESWRLSADAVEVWWPGRTRLVVRRAVLQGPAGLTVAAESTTWDVVDITRDDLRVTLRRPQEGLVLSRSAGPGGETWAVEADDLAVGRLLDVRRFDQPLLDGGTIRGSLALRTSDGVVGFDLDLAARSARLPALAAGGPDRQALGEPTRMSARVGGSWRRAEGTLDIPRWRATIEGAALSGSLVLRDLEADPAVDLTLDVERADFARLLRTSGLGAPENLGPAAVDGRGEDLGSASLAARAQGRISDPASFTVRQRLDFRPPRRMPSAIERLRGGFVHEVDLTSGGTRAIDVSPSSPDFIPLAEVPPLFLRALLLGEDAGFYTHPGVDLREMPAALLTDWARGGAARGASTITQQLAKNLFLSHEKRLGRKLQELSLALLLESALGKARILEIYLNVIEWGPDLFGLRPAARAYFDREPRDLTPAQIAFLVSLIPGPVKYQSSFAHGTPGPGLRLLVDALLSKLRSVDALTEDEYRRALEEEIVVRGHEAARGASARSTPAGQPGLTREGSSPRIRTLAAMR